MKTKCLACGTIFEGVRETGLCSDDCRRKWKNQYSRNWSKSHKKVDAAKKGEPSAKGRTCPDCGKPTTDYRCPKCWNKRRVAMGIPISGEGAGYSEYDI